MATRIFAAQWPNCERTELRVAFAHHEAEAAVRFFSCREGPLFSSLTPLECARLMGADNFGITVPLNQALFGFGDAVCVPVIRWIAENYLTPVWKELHANEIKKGQYVARAV